jgi:hypothetical protein
VDEARVTELEAAIADAGALVVRAQKYRRGAGPEGEALLREALALGDGVRRLHRHGLLDDAAVGGFLAEAAELVARLHALLGAIREGGEYAAAVAAHARGDQAALARVLPLVFAGLEPVAGSRPLFAPIAWRRRNRPRPVADVVAELASARDEGLPGGGDDLSPGTDTRLPAVVLRPEPPRDEPLAIALEAGALRDPVFRLVDTDEHLVYTARLRAPFGVVVAPELPADDDDPASYLDWRPALLAALAAAGLSAA